MQAKVIVGKSHPSHAIGTPPRKGATMKPFARHMESLTQIRHSFCSSMFMTTTIVLVFVTIGLPQAASGQTCPKLPATITQCPYRKLFVPHTVTGMLCILSSVDRPRQKTHCADIGTVG
jgi:hypothetical protein